MIGYRLHNDNFLDDIFDRLLIYPLVSRNTPSCTDHALVSPTELVVAPFGSSFMHLYPTTAIFFTITFFFRGDVCISAGQSTKREKLGS